MALHRSHDVAGNAVTGRERPRQTSGTADSGFPASMVSSVRLVNTLNLCSFFSFRLGGLMDDDHPRELRTAIHEQGLPPSFARACRPALKVRWCRPKVTFSSSELIYMLKAPCPGPAALRRCFPHLRFLISRHWRLHSCMVTLGAALESLEQVLGDQLRTLVYAMRDGPGTQGGSCTGSGSSLEIPQWGAPAAALPLSGNMRAPFPVSSGTTEVQMCPVGGTRGQRTVMQADGAARLQALRDKVPQAMVTEDPLLRRHPIHQPH